MTTEERQRLTDLVRRWTEKADHIDATAAVFSSDEGIVFALREASEDLTTLLEEIA